MSKTYSEKRECNDCGGSYNASVYIGVGRDTTDGLCSDCYTDQRKERIDRVLTKYPKKWYRPDSDEYVITVYKPDGERRYYRHDIHAIERIERWYSE